MSGSWEPDLAGVAWLIGEPARASMLSALLGGVLTAGELAQRAAVARSTASDHLDRLVKGGLITRTVAGRERRYALANEQVAELLEVLARMAVPAGRLPTQMQALRFARTCYDHVAGVVGVLIMGTLVECGLITADGRDVTASGAAWFGKLGMDVAALRQQRRVLARPCLDWSERRDHLAGAAGAALAATMLARGWLVRQSGTRAVRLTLRGREGLYRSLGLTIEKSAP